MQKTYELRIGSNQRSHVYLKRLPADRQPGGNPAPVAQCLVEKTAVDSRGFAAQHFATGLPYNFLFCPT